MHFVRACCADMFVFLSASEQTRECERHLYVQVSTRTCIVLDLNHLVSINYDGDLVLDLAITLSHTPTHRYRRCPQRKSCSVNKCCARAHEPDIIEVVDVHRASEKLMLKMILEFVLAFDNSYKHVQCNGLIRDKVCQKSRTPTAKN